MFFQSQELASYLYCAVSSFWDKKRGNETKRKFGGVGGQEEESLPISKYSLPYRCNAWELVLCRKAQGYQESFHCCCWDMEQDHDAAPHPHPPPNRSTNPAASVTLHPTMRPWLSTGNDCRVQEQLHSFFPGGRPNPRGAGFQENEFFSPVLRKERNGGYVMDS